MANIFDNDKILNRSLDEVMSESFGRYAKYIIQDRALPDIRDGLKPVQRRILYAMNDLNIHFDKAYKKSARTVGEVIGKYHPHGDSSIYEAMVRMSQEWKNNVPLLDMQGNKGSIDGDSPAAMRYTECRLSKYGQLLLDDIKKDTVKFIYNFDDSEQEPSILPSLIPNILINGSTGIAAGYATNVPPFNFNEILDAIIFKIKHKHCTLLEIASIIKGPDFPTGGIIQGIDGILDIYKSGKGKFNIRAKFSEIVRHSNKKHKQLIITELPYEVNKATLVKAIDELRISNKLPGLKEVRDDSDKNGISIMLELETEKELDVIKNFLYKNTQLQISYSANIILIKDRKPMQLGMLEIIDAYLSHANEIIIKAATFDLNKALSRKEILEGLITAISNIDLLVDLIKSSTSKDEAKQKIIEHFNINEKQAEAVIQLRLYILTSYDTQKLKDEFNGLLLFIKEKKDLIENHHTRNNWLINKLKEYKNSFDIQRKTIIEDEIEDIVIQETDIIEEKHGIAILTRDNYIKFMHVNDIDDIDLERLKIKENDIPIEILYLSTLQTLVCFTNKGKCVSIPAHKIKFTKPKDNGIHINEIITMDSADKAIAAMAINKTSDISSELVIATKKSLIKRMTIEELIISKNAKISSYIHLKSDDEVCSVFIAKSNVDEIATITESGFSIRFNINEIPLVGKSASGVKNINLKDNDLVAASFPIKKDESFIYIGSNRGSKRIYFDDIAISSRTKVGKKIISQVDSNPYIINCAFMISGRQSLNVLEENGKLNSIKASEVPISDIYSRMSKYPNDIVNVILTTIVDLKRNHINENLENNFLTLQNKETPKLNIKSKIDEYEADRNLNIEKNKDILSNIHTNINLDDKKNSKEKTNDFFINEIEDELNNVDSVSEYNKENIVEKENDNTNIESKQDKFINDRELDHKVNEDPLEYWDKAINKDEVNFHDDDGIKTDVDTISERTLIDTDDIDKVNETNNNIEVNDSNEDQDQNETGQDIEDDSLNEDQKDDETNNNIKDNSNESQDDNESNYDTEDNHSNGNQDQNASDHDRKDDHSNEDQEDNEINIDIEDNSSENQEDNEINIDIEDNSSENQDDNEIDNTIEDDNSNSDEDQNETDQDIKDNNSNENQEDNDTSIDIENNSNEDKDIEEDNSNESQDDNESNQDIEEANSNESQKHNETNQDIEEINSNENQDNNEIDKGIEEDLNDYNGEHSPNKVVSKILNDNNEVDKKNQDIEENSSKDINTSNITYSSNSDSSNKHDKDNDETDDIHDDKYDDILGLMKHIKK